MCFIKSTFSCTNTTLCRYTSNIITDIREMYTQETWTVYFRNIIYNILSMNCETLGYHLNCNISTKERFQFYSKNFNYYYFFFLPNKEYRLSYLVLIMLYSKYILKHCSIRFCQFNRLKFHLKFKLHIFKQKGNIQTIIIIIIVC